MLLSTHLRLLLPALLSLADRTTGHPSRKHCSSNHATTGKAIYFLTNEESNGVVALPIGADGTLSKGTMTETGGAGSVAHNSDGQPATPDALVSQSSLAIAGQHIFAVNAHSNSLSMLAISESDPTMLTLVGEPVSVPGEFPNTVAVSAKNKLVCVGTTGAMAGVACSSFTEAGLGPMDRLRQFDIGQSTPPVGPTNTVSQVLFSADESMLLTMVKGDPAVDKAGFISSFSVQRTMDYNGALGMNVAEVETRSSPNGTAVLFGSQAIPGTSNVFATDAAFGAAIISIDPETCEATTVATKEIDGQAATCWATISPSTKTAFVTDVAVNRLVEMSTEDASILSMLDLSCNGDPGLIDLTAAGDFIYALSPGNGTTEAAVSVVDLTGGSGNAKMLQHFGLMGIAGKTAQGMVALA